MNHPDEKLAELRARLCGEGLNNRFLISCGISGVMTAKGETEVSERIKDGWTTLCMDGGHYLMVKINDGWLDHKPQETLAATEEARL